jgi:hypothetical protein
MFNVLVTGMIVVVVRTQFTKSASILLRFISLGDKFMKITIIQFRWFYTDAKSDNSPYTHRDDGKPTLRVATASWK